MNHCLLEVEVIQAPTIRYTQDNQTPIAEMDVRFDGLRPDDAPGQMKVVGWGNLAQELPNRVQVGQRLVVEGRLRMNTVPRQDGTKEKRAEFTLSRLHPLSGLRTPAPLVREPLEATNPLPAALLRQGRERCPANPNQDKWLLPNQKLLTGIAHRLFLIPMTFLSERIS